MIPGTQPAPSTRATLREFARKYKKSLTSVVRSLPPHERTPYVIRLIQATSYRYAALQKRWDQLIVTDITRWSTYTNWRDEKGPRLSDMLVLDENHGHLYPSIRTMQNTIQRLLKKNDVQRALLRSL